MNKQVTAENTYKFDNGDHVTVQVSDTKDGFAIRLVINGYENKWQSHYESLTIGDKGSFTYKTYVLGSCYGLLPRSEVPYCLVEGTFIK